MFIKPSLLTRIFFGQLIGFVFAAVSVILFHHNYPDLGWMSQLGFVLYYIIIGASVGMMGVITYLPLLEMPITWWMRGPWIGGWMNLALMFLIFDELAIIQSRSFGESSILASPWMFILEGAILGLLIDFICTKIAGEGIECVANDKNIDDI